jgi:hypothetical protein
MATQQSTSHAGKCTAWTTAWTPTPFAQSETALASEKRNPTFQISIESMGQYRAMPIAFSLQPLLIPDSIREMIIPTCISHKIRPGGKIDM